METCRTCAKCDFDYEGQWIDLFNLHLYKNEIDLLFIEFNIWKLKITLNDGLPHKVCGDCMLKFRNVSAFRLQCLEAQSKLDNIFEKIDTQTSDNYDVFIELTTQPQHQSQHDETGELSKSQPINHEMPSSTRTAISFKTTEPTEQTQPTTTLEVAVAVAAVVAKQNNNRDNEIPPVIGRKNILPAKAMVSNTTIRKQITYTAAIETEYTKKSFNKDNENQKFTEKIITNNLLDPDDIQSSISHPYNLIHTNNINVEDNTKIAVTFECRYCYKSRDVSSQSFQKQSELLAHITEKHNSDNPYNCPYCERGFQDAASRTTHIKSLHCQKLYRCETCGKGYADRFNLRNHIEKYHSDTDYDCTLCQKSFLSRKSLNYHMKWHNPKNQLKCNYCDRLFINQRHLRCHEETHTGYRNQEVCTFCGKSFIHLKTLRWHIYRQHGGEKPYRCSNCTEVFASYVEKRLHMLEFHLENLTAIERSECMLCHKRCLNASELRRHMVEDHRDNKGSVKINNNKRVIMNKRQKHFTGLFQCTECDKRFNMKSALARHQAVHSTEGRPYVCQQCPKRFKRSQDLNWHLKTHSNEKPNICDICGKGFALKYVLTQHRRSHEVLEKNFTCTKCGRSYLFEKSLRLHERIHTGKTYYTCDLCSESFVTHVKFKCHMSKMHDEQEVIVSATNLNNNNNGKLPLDDLINIAFS